MIFKIHGAENVKPEHLKITNNAIKLLQDNTDDIFWPKTPINIHLSSYDSPDYNPETLPTPPPLFYTENNDINEIDKHYPVAFNNSIKYPVYSSEYPLYVHSRFKNNKPELSELTLAEHLNELLTNHLANEYVHDYKLFPSTTKNDLRHVLDVIGGKDGKKDISLNNFNALLKDRSVKRNHDYLNSILNTILDHVKHPVNRLDKLNEYPEKQKKLLDKLKENADYLEDDALSHK